MFRACHDTSAPYNCDQTRCGNPWPYLSLSQPGLTLLFLTGTSSIVDEKTHEPILSILTLIVETAAKLHRAGHNVVLVSSGAVGVGLRRMDVDERPNYLPRIQVEHIYHGVNIRCLALLTSTNRHWRLSANVGL